MSSESTPKRRPLREKPQRVLIADDDHLIGSGLTSALQSLGFEAVGPSPNGAEAVALADEQSRDLGVDLAILDIAMPEMNGLEAARQLWERHTIPSLIVSAYSEDAYLNEVDASFGIFGYLLKPVGTEDLRVAVAVAWRRSIIERERAGRIAQLEENLKNRQTVERAKWRLVEGFSMSEADSHSRLQRAARDGRRPLVSVAAEVIEATDEQVRALLKF